MAPFEPLSFRSPVTTGTERAARPWPARLGWIGLAVAVHVALLAALALVPPPDPITPPEPLAVEILQAAAPRPVEAPKPVPKPQPVQKRAATPPIPVSREPIPTALTTQAAPTPAQPAPPAPEPAPAKAAEPAPIVQPRFDAAYLNNPAPTYPSMSRRLGETGKVFLRAHVLPSGLPDQVEIRTSSGSARLDNAALEAVKRWRFVPARQGNEAIAQWVVVPISFNLEN